MIKDEDKRAFLKIVSENFKIIRELGLTADEVRARFGLLPPKDIETKGTWDEKDLVPKGTWDEKDLVPNPE